MSEKPTKLTGQERSSALESVPKWREVSGRDAIERKFQFDSFIDAFAFMSASALHAEKHDHHPEWFNVYNRVNVTLATHDCNGFSQKDVRLASFMDNLCSKIRGCQ
eukprot:TRINITY_DN2564_c0_g1_i1.p1 TRINITY_DN2564_c0_g1~~TRINITY_DN2564_c0_g1_i1.p1  ORF type:complete len:106 (-),score=25.04 TRINITY_DN2564_c0_g1_i1:16-333(-)